MKKIISLILAVMLAFSMVVVPVMADGSATATLTASLNGDTTPVVGEKFVVDVALSNISSELFLSGVVEFSWPTAVASLAKKTNGEVTTKLGQAVSYNLDMYDASMEEGKYVLQTDTSKLEEGTAEFGYYIHPEAEDQGAVAGATYDMFSVSFVLNEGQVYDDFYFTVNEVIVYLGEKGASSSKLSTGEITATSIEKTEAVIWENAVWQPGVDKGINTVASGVYELPEALTAGKTYEVYFTLQTSGTQSTNTLVGLNNSAVMTSGAYFGNSTVMMKFDGNTEINVRNAGSTTKVGNLSVAATTVDVKVTVDLINNNWGLEVTENGAVTVNQTGIAFRNANLPIDALVLADNDSIPSCLFVDASTVKVVDTTPATVGDVIFKYVDAEGNVLEEAKMSGETGAEVSVVAKTITTADGVKYSAPVASGVVGTDTEVTVTCTKIEVVTVNFTLNGEVVATTTVEGVAGAEVAYNSGNYVAADGVYAATGTLTVDVAALEVAVELEAVALGIVSTVNQSTEGVHALDKQMTAAGTVTFDLTVLNAKDSLVALDKAAVLTDNYFRDSSAYLQLKDGKIQISDGTVQELGAFELGKTYSVEFVLDVTNKTYTVTIMDGETEFAKVENFGMRNTNVDVIDSIVVIDNGGGGAGAVVVSNLVVETEDEQPSEEESTAPSEEESTTPSEEESTAPSEEESTAPSEEESTTPSEEESTTPSEEESTAPSEEESTAPSEEPEELPFEAVDVNVETSALGVTITGKFVDEDTTYTTVVVVISYLKDGKAYSVQAVEVDVKDGEVKIPASNVTLAEGELTVAGISVLVGVNALEAITTNNLGTPVGVWK